MGKIILKNVDYSAPVTSGIAGVKGNEENNYRTGNVNLTPENIGALSLNGGTMNTDASIYMNGVDTSIFLSNESSRIDILCDKIITQDSFNKLSLFSKIAGDVGSSCGIEAHDKTNSKKCKVRFYNGNIFCEPHDKLAIQITKNPELARVYTFDETSLWSISEEVDLGKSSFHWRNIYANNGTLQTSDRTRKTDINNLETQKVQAFINGLNPVSYKMIDGTSGRTHYGFIAQDIEELMNDLNMDSSDFAGFIKSPKKTIKYEDENGKKLENPIEEVIKGEYDYALRYDEFIAPLIKVVQEQQKAIENQQQQIIQLKKALENANL